MAMCEALYGKIDGKLPDGVRRLIARLGRFRFVFPLSSAGYCAIHWLTTHHFSFYLLSGALVFGAAAATAVALGIGLLSAPPST